MNLLDLDYHFLDRQHVLQQSEEKHIIFEFLGQALRVNTYIFEFLGDGSHMVEKMKNERDQDRIYVPLLRFEEGKFLLIFHAHIMTFLRYERWGNLNEFDVPFIVP